SYTTRDCFSLSSRHDITFKGKKIVGSAQRRNRISFLQHGSILIDIRKNLWENIFLHKTDFSKVGSLKEFGVEVEKEKLIEFLKTGFEEVFDIEFELMEISKKEMEECKKLAEKILIKKEEKNGI
ncbi:lipoate--protein ligase family protein, partial [bacterium]|nr:lipoate--protein ligase family protein [bacterium]